MNKNFMKTIAITIALTICSTLFAYDKLIWANRSTDMNAASSWNDLDGNVSTVAPSSNTLLMFDDIAKVQPVLTADLTVIGLYFGSSTNSDVISVHPADGYEGYNYCGYHITAQNGAVLTLDGNQHNNGWTRDIQMASKGTNIIDVAINFTDKNVTHKARSSGGYLFLNKPLTATATSSFQIDSNAKGYVVFGAANPDFTPKSFNINGWFGFTNPEAVVNVPKFISGCWSWSQSVNGFASDKNCRFDNMSDEEAFLNAQTIELSDHDGFNFYGSPINLSNTTFKATMRDGKTVGVDSTVVTLKEIVCTANANNRQFSKAGAGTLINLGGFCSNSIYTNLLKVQKGAYVAMKPEGLSKYQNLLHLDVHPSESIPATLGVNFDYNPKNNSGYDDALTFYHNKRPGGFTAYGGERHINLYDGAMLWCNMANAVLGGDYKESFGSSIGLSAKGATGTVIIDNDINLNNTESNTNYNGRDFYVNDGIPFVDARIQGMITNSPASKPDHLFVALHKKGEGVLALDGYFYGTSTSSVRAGGLLINKGVDCKYQVYTNAWIGGTGVTKALQIDAGGALRPGEQGGTLKVTGELTLKNGAKVIIDVNPNGTHGCANFTGSNVKLKAEGDIVFELNAFEKGEGGNKVKVLDWSEATATDVTAFDLEKYSLEYDEEMFSYVKLTKEDTAMYVSYRYKNPNPTMIIIR
ncbi:MAG: hypothetical protein J6V41_04110 [Kiritimatiellae bacterium]|nr:hypothetical protein [Kiritimatiellia bacterium]